VIVNNEAILFECDVTDYERLRLESLMRTRVFRALRNGFGLRLDNLHTYPLAMPDAAEPVGSPRWAVWSTEHGGGRGERRRAGRWSDGVAVIDDPLVRRAAELLHGLALSSRTDGLPVQAEALDVALQLLARTRPSQPGEIEPKSAE
jgi:hypothetical protein